MNTKDGYAKKSLTSARLLTADGGDTDNYLPLTGGTMTGALVTTALSVSGAATFSQAINGNILGNAATASRLQNARTISLTGAVTGSGSFDGSGNLSIATTSSSITSLTSDILYGSVSSNAGKYEPYSSTTANSTWVSNNSNAGKLYLGTQAPSKTTRLNYNGYLYATKLYSGGTEVSVNGHDHSYVNTIGLNGTKITWSVNGTAQTDIQLPLIETNTTYLASTNITITDITTSDFIDCSITGTSTESNYIILTLNKAEPASGTIIRITTSTEYTRSDNYRLVLKFNNSNNKWSAINPSEAISNYNNKWYTLKRYPISPSVNYFFKMRYESGTGYHYADFLGTDVKFISASGGSGGGGGSSVTLPSSDITLSTTAQTYITADGVTRKIKLPSSNPWGSSAPTATSWADSTGTRGIVSPTLTDVDKPKIYIPKGEYSAFPVMQDSSGNLWIALPKDITTLCNLEEWGLS